MQTLQKLCKIFLLGPFFLSFLRCFCLFVRGGVFLHTSCSELVNGQHLDFLGNCSPCFGDEAFARKVTLSPLVWVEDTKYVSLRILFHSGTECLHYLLIFCCALGCWVIFPVGSKHLQWCPANMISPAQGSFELYHAHWVTSSWQWINPVIFLLCL